MTKKGNSMKQYIKIEAKRLISTLPGFLAALLGTLLLGAFLLFLAGHFLPKALEVQPFRVGLCVEGEGLTKDYIKTYVNRMKTTENLVEFVEVQKPDAENALQEKELAACIIIPERTIESIMDGTNIPVRVIMGAGTDNAERYLQQRLLALLTQCGAALIDVPQAEMLLSYEIQAENLQEIGRMIDLFHFGLAIDRESWFREEVFNVFGGTDIRGYYLAAGTTLLFLFWGLGSGSFFREQEKNLPLFLERKGVSLPFQQGVRQVFYMGLYMSAAVLLVFLFKSIGADEMMPFGTMAGAAVLLLCAVMSALQSGFFFTLAPTTASGIVLNSIWGMAGFFGAGGVLPTVFLPKFLVKICNGLPAGICMELLRQASGKRRMGGKAAGLCLLWCLIFGMAGQIIFCGRQRYRKRK